MDKRSTGNILLQKYRYLRHCREGYRFFAWDVSDMFSLLLFLLIRFKKKYFLYLLLWGSPFMYHTRGKNKNLSSHVICCVLCIILSRNFQRNQPGAKRGDPRLSYPVLILGFLKIAFHPRLRAYLAPAPTPFHSKVDPRMKLRTESRTKC